jgi:transcriptional regulator with XRE-family HTH domain
MRITNNKNDLNRIINLLNHTKVWHIVYMNVGTRLRKLIKERGLKQKWVAEQCGLNEANFQRILDNKQAPSAQSLAGISRALNVSTDWILGLKDEAS